jgi:glycosyltransferase involved in cell wall biosynthesis
MLVANEGGGHLTQEREQQALFVAPFHSSVNCKQYTSAVKMLIVTSNYFPEPLGIGLYSHDLALSLKSQGHHVTVLTTFPYYPWWETPREFESYAKQHSVLDGVDVYRTNLKIADSKSTLFRMLFEFRMWIGLRKVFKKIPQQEFDRIISIIPSLGAGLVASRISKKNRTPHFLVIQDITTTGVSESGTPFGSLLRYTILPIERAIIRSAHSVAVISKNMITPVSKIAGDSIQIVHLPNYETGLDEKVPKLLRKHFDIPPNEFVVLHAGSIARKQNLENLVFTARLLESQNIGFYLFGHGNAQEEVLLASRGLNNFSIRPSVPKHSFKSLLACADLLIVNERPTQFSMALPSKLISYFSSNVPVLAAVPEGGATYQEVKGLALWVDAGRPDELAKMIRKIADSPNSALEYAKNARRYYENVLTSEAGRKRYLDWILETIKE